MAVMLSRRVVLAALFAIGRICSIGIGAHAEPQSTDPLPSWNDGPTKKSILDFVAAVTKDGGPDYVAPAERIATIDNDGTLWIEQPIYTQFAFAIDRVKATANKHPEWKTQEPFASILKGDLKGLGSMDQAKRAGELLAERAKAAGVESCVFDRGGYQYHGRVKALAEGAREGGLVF